MEENLLTIELSVWHSVVFSDMKPCDSVDTTLLLENVLLFTINSYMFRLFFFKISIVLSHRNVY